MLLLCLILNIDIVVIDFTNVFDIVLQEGRWIELL